VLFGFLAQVELEFGRELFLLAPPAAPAIPASENARSLTLLIHRTQDQSHGPREHLPLRLFGDELSASARREAIVPGAFAFFRQLP
jgi:hypothetical protein